MKDHTVEPVAHHRQSAALRPHGLIHLWEAKRDWLMKIIRRRLDKRLFRRVDEADILQEVYLDIANKFDKYNEERLLDDSAPSTDMWLLLVANQRVMQEHRRHFGTAARDIRREIALVAPGDAGDSPNPLYLAEARAETPSAVLARTERVDQVLATLAKLPQVDREILTHRDLEGLSNDDCAGILGISKAAASNRYHRAKDRFRVLIDRNPTLDL